ncbi:hypothetical protein [Streptomyces sp. NPDC088137]|uniref:hypothetical protein n=1 Tax=Streptomyces sp. NPDC088137 TaxID=3365827 RepID=UPI00382C3068
MTNRFLANYGDHMFMETVYDPGNGNEEKLEGLRAARRRLRDDREAGLYDDAEDAEWFQSRYASLTSDIKKMEAESIRPAGMVSRPTGRTVEMEWSAAQDDGERRKLLQEFGARIRVWPADHTPRYEITFDPEANEDAREITSR